MVMFPTFIGRVVRRANTRTPRLRQVRVTGKDRQVERSTLHSMSVSP
jgi:hypothetical protein